MRVGRRRLGGGRLSLIAVVATTHAVVLLRAAGGIYTYSHISLSVALYGLDFVNISIVLRQVTQARLPPPPPPLLAAAPRKRSRSVPLVAAAFPAGELRRKELPSRKELLPSIPKLLLP